MYKVVEGHELAIASNNRDKGGQYWLLNTPIMRIKTLLKTILPISQNATNQYQLKLLFFVRITYDWNKLNDSVINTDSVNSFRNRLSTSHFTKCALIPSCQSQQWSLRRTTIQIQSSHYSVNGSFKG